MIMWELKGFANATTFKPLFDARSKGFINLSKNQVANITWQKSLWFCSTQNDHNLCDINTFYFIDN